jgi:hypothetical protein
MPMKHVVWVLLASAAASACGGDDVYEVPAPASCLPGCAGVRTYDAQAYDLHARFDWDSSTLTATEDITLDTSQSGAIVELDAAVDITRVYTGDQNLAYIVDPTARTLTVDVTPVGTGSATTFSVDYSAKVDGTTSQTSGTSLILSSSTSDDPCKSRVLYTDSEPDRALFWLVTQLDPSDRALWSVDMTIGSDEDVIANGTRVSDQTNGDTRTVGYALDKPIPAYMMAFAAGQLEHTDRAAADGVVPLSVWYRRGFVLDPQLTLNDVTTAMKVFNAEIMPYPWDTYSVVLLPYGGGMENATITFNDEFSGQGAGDFVLNAHELSHHWFGDWVTMHGFDDVWFKEGMATVLESEAEKAVRDSTHAATAGSAGRLWGTDYNFNPDDAIVDDSLHGLDKYTSGPYERAGWTISQIRATVGETAFFAGLRKLLAEHALGSATGEQFIRSFQPALDEATVQKLLAALPQKPTPTLTVTATAGSDSTALAVSLADPSAVMIYPMDLAVVDATGSATVTHVVPGTPVTLTVPADGYLGVDERDVHPHWYYDFNENFSQYNPISTRLAPPITAPPPPLAAFATRSAAQQEKAGDFGELPIALASQLPAYIASLGSVDAQESAVIAACARGKTDATWMTAVEPLLETPPVAAFNSGLSACGTTYPQATLEPELKAAIAGGTPADLARAEYLISFDYGSADSTAIIGGLADNAPTLRLREYAGERIQLAQQGQSGYSHRAVHGGRHKTHLRAAP